MCFYYIHFLDIVKMFLENFFFFSFSLLIMEYSIFAFLFCQADFSKKLEKVFSVERDPSGVSLDVRTVKREFVLV